MNRTRVHKGRARTYEGEMKMQKSREMKGQMKWRK